MKCTTCRGIIPNDRLGPICESCITKRSFAELLRQQLDYMPHVKTGDLDLRIGQGKGAIRHVLLMRSDRWTFCAQTIEHYKKQSFAYAKLPPGICKDCLAQLEAALALEAQRAPSGGEL